MEAIRYINLVELNAANKRYDGNIDSSIELKDHQLVLLKEMIEREKKRIVYNSENNENSEYVSVLNDTYDEMYSDIGILADKVGSGKSYTILALIASGIKPSVAENISNTYAKGHFVLVQKQKMFEKKDVNIIVIPHGLVKQWRNYIETFSKNLRYFLVNKQTSIENLMSRIDDLDIILVTGTFYKQVRGLFYNNNFKATRVIFDEVDSTNTPSAHFLACDFMWLVTASYKNILFPVQKINIDRRNLSNSHVVSNGIYNNQFIKRLFIHVSTTMRQIEKYALDRIIVKNSDEFIEESFKLPQMRTQLILCKSSIEIEILRGVVNGDILRCMNAGDFKSAVGFINQNNLETETNIIDDVLKDLNTNMSNLCVRENAAKQLIYNTGELRDSALLRFKGAIEDVKNKINLMTTRIKESNLCIICYSDYENRCISKCCKNSFCFGCINKWLNVSHACPMCKTTVTIQEDYFVVKSREELNDLKLDTHYTEGITVMTTIPGDDARTKQLNKFDNLERLVSNRKSYSKFLIFSDFEHSFSAMYPYLEKSGLKYAHIKGNGVANIVDKYKNGDIDALLINSKNFGSGLNLENTTDVILFHKFEDQLEKQVIGRAQRPGRKTPLNVWYFVNENEHMGS
jgi:SNF2 family DNA or RNA helicase